jgi:hypothetical protein
MIRSAFETQLGPNETPDAKFSISPAERLAAGIGRATQEAKQAAVPIVTPPTDFRVYRLIQNTEGRYEVVIVATRSKQPTVQPNKQTRFTTIDTSRSGELLDIYFAGGKSGLREQDAAALVELYANAEPPPGMTRWPTETLRALAVGLTTAAALASGLVLGPGEAN